MSGLKGGKQSGSGTGIYMAARDNEKERVIPRHLQHAIHNDEELNKLLHRVTILPNIQTVEELRLAASKPPTKPAFFKAMEIIKKSTLTHFFYCFNLWLIVHFSDRTRCAMSRWLCKPHLLVVSGRGWLCFQLEGQLFLAGMFSGFQVLQKIS